jgi:hypothetical protein
MKMAEFIEQHGITMSVKRVDDNPNMPAELRDARSGTATPMDHWKVTLRMGNARMTSYFSMGSGHEGKPPTAADVLDCMGSDASGLENAKGFEDWAGEYGYDTESRKAERIYKKVQQVSYKLRQFLGQEAYESLLWHTERE